jgi:putative transposase
MLDHWHVLIRPYPNVVIETMIGAVKQNMLRQIWTVRKCPTFWQERFLDHRIRHEKDFEHHLEYIRLNPVKHGLVKHGLVERPEDYP